MLDPLNDLPKNVLNDHRNGLKNDVRSLSIVSSLIDWKEGYSTSPSRGYQRSIPSMGQDFIIPYIIGKLVRIELLPQKGWSNMSPREDLFRAAPPQKREKMP